MTEINSEAKYPECEKMSAVQNESRTLSGFLDWLDEKELSICDEGGEYEDRWFPILRSKEDLIADYFGINLNKVEQERRAMLDEIRKAQDDQAPPA